MKSLKQRLKRLKKKNQLLWNKQLSSASGTKLLGILINVGTRHCLVPTLICQLNLLGSHF